MLKAKDFFYSDIDIKKIFDKLIDNGCKVLMECSCKISKNIFSPNRRILGISEPDNNKIFYYLKLMNIPSIFLDFIYKNFDKNKKINILSFIILGFDNNMLRKIYIRYNKAHMFIGGELNNEGDIKLSKYIYNDVLDLSLNKRVESIFHTFNKNTGHIRYDDSGNAIAFHIRCIEKEITVSEIKPYVEKWINLKMSPKMEMWFHNNSNRIVSYISPSINTPTSISIYHTQGIFIK